MSHGPADPFLATDAAFTAFGGPEEVARVRRGMWILATAPRPPVGLTPHEVVFRQNKLTVRFYRPRPQALTHLPAVPRLPVVLIPSLINRSYILDLEPERSLVAALAQYGHPTYLIDWGVPGPEDATDDVAHVLLDLLHRSIDRVCRHAGTSQALLFGYCQGGTLAAMYAALRPTRVRALATLAAPVRFAGAGRFASFVQKQTFDVDRAIDADGLLPVDVMKSAFKLLDPMGNWSKHLGIEAAAREPAALARVLARERWLEENVPMPGAFAREFIRHTYQDDDLLAGRWALRGERVDLSAIRCPLLVVACRNDFIAPHEACAPLATAVASSHVQVELLDVGHIGVVVGSMGPKRFYPLLDRWLVGAQP
jgi:polyhydroxyalkanoate synthase